MSITKYKLKSGKNGYLARTRLKGHMVGRRFRHKVEATAWIIDQKILEKNDETPAREEKGFSMTVADLTEYWVKEYAIAYKEKSSVQRDKVFIKNQILPNLGNTLLRNLTMSSIQSWVVRLKNQGLAPKTCNDALGLIKKMLNDAVEWDFLRKNPALKVKRFDEVKKRMQYWTEKETNIFLEYVKSKDMEYFPFFFIALNTGMRKGEIAGLKWDSIDWQRNLIEADRSYCFVEKSMKEYTKTKELKYIPINDQLLRLLEDLKQGDNSEFVLARGLDYEHLHRRIKILAEKAGVKQIRFHDLRHTFASLFMDKGCGSLYDLQQILGHQSFKMTERYRHFDGKNLIGKTAKLTFRTREENEQDNEK